MEHTKYICNLFSNINSHEYFKSFVHEDNDPVFNCVDADIMVSEGVRASAAI